MARQKVKVSFSRRAEKDLHEIYRFLAERSIEALQRVDREIFSALRRLALFPRSGHFVKEFAGKKYREVTVFHYRIIYRHLEKEKQVRVFTIRHGKRFLPTF